LGGQLQLCKCTLVARAQFAQKIIETVRKTRLHRMCRQNGRNSVAVFSRGTGDPRGMAVTGSDCKHTLAPHHGQTKHDRDTRSRLEHIKVPTTVLADADDIPAFLGKHRKSSKSLGPKANPHLLVSIFEVFSGCESPCFPLTTT